MEAYSRATELNANDADNWWWQGGALEDLGRQEEALEAFSRATDLNPSDALNWRGKGRTLSDMGRHEEALEAYSHAAELNPNDALNWRAKGLALLQLNRLEEALQASSRATDLDPGSAFDWWAKGYVLLHMDDLDGALEALARATDLDPGNARNWAAKGQALLNSGDASQAAQAFQRATKIDPGQGDLWLGLAETYLALGPRSYRKALEASERGLSTGATGARANLLYTRATSLLLLGRITDALGGFDEAISLDPEDHRYWRNKAVAHLNLQQTDAAESAVRHAAALTAHSSDEEDQQSHRLYHEWLQRLSSHGRRVVWWEWWFGAGSVTRRSVGGVLLLALAIYIVLPLVTLNTDLFAGDGWYLWPNAGSSWESYVVPVAALGILLLSPMLTRIGPHGLELTPTKTPAELDPAQLIKALQPSPDTLHREGKRRFRDELQRQRAERDMGRRRPEPE